MADHRNDFAAIRLGAALVVLLSHAFPLCGAIEPVIGAMTLGHLAVLVFFGASGYLITESWESDPRLPAFFVKRALRIFPGLIVVAFAAAFVIGPLVTLDPVSAYFASGAPLDYALSNSATFLDIDLPGVFTNNPATMDVNPPLWTLHFEVIAYLFAGAVGLLGRWTSRTTSTVALLALLVVSLVFELRSHGGGGPVAAFAAGALLHRWQGAVPWSPAAAVIAVCLFAAAGVGGFSSLERILGSLVIPYATIVAAYSTSGRWSERLGGHDLSYGIYLWSFLLQQTLLSVLPPVNPVVFVALSVAVTLPVAAASWLLIERPALRLKGRVLGARAPLAAAAVPAAPTPLGG